MRHVVAIGLLLALLPSAIEAMPQKGNRGPGRPGGPPGQGGTIPAPGTAPTPTAPGGYNCPTFPNWTWPDFTTGRSRPSWGTPSPVPRRPPAPRTNPRRRPSPSSPIPPATPDRPGGAPAPSDTPPRPGARGTPSGNRGSSSAFPPGLMGRPLSGARAAPNPTARPRPTPPLWPVSGGSDLVEDVTAWELWWRFNHDPYLSVPLALERRTPRTGPGASRREELLAAFENEARPVLRRLLVEGGSTLVLRDALRAVARVVDEDPDLMSDFESYALHYLALPYEDLRLAAILSLGIASTETAVPRLGSLLADGEAGRDLAGGPVSERERAFAAYALGLIARESEPHVRAEVAAALVDALQGTPLEVRVACALALGQAPVAVCAPDQDGEALPYEEHFCGANALVALSDIVDDDDEVSWLRAHAAASLGRLGATIGDVAVRHDVAGELLHVLDPRTDVVDLVRHGAVIGLGMLAKAERDIGPPLRKRLRWLAENGDPMTRRLSLVSLGRAAGSGASEEREVRDVRDYLLSELYRGRKGRKGWAALAVGVYAHERRAAGRATSIELVKAMRESLRVAKNVTDAGAFVLGLGMLHDGDPRGRETLMRRFDRTGDPVFRGRAALVLGLLGAGEAEPLLREGLDDDPSLAIPLRLLGDAAALSPLLERLAARDEDDRLAAIAALGRIGEPGAVAPLARLLASESEPVRLRAAAAVALGELADGDPLPWDAVYANDLQYHLLTETLSSTRALGLGLLDGR